MKSDANKAPAVVGTNQNTSLSAQIALRTQTISRGTLSLVAAADDADDANAESNDCSGGIREKYLLFLLSVLLNCRQ